LKKKKTTKISKGDIISVSVVIGVIILIGVIALNSFSPVNSDDFVFASSTNIFLKSVKSPEGIYHYQYAKSGKSAPNAGGVSPPISISKGNLIQIHLINEEKNQSSNPSKHNLNIDEFNVHVKDLGYFQTESITFLANKLGTFDYYCSIHPEMRGTISVTE